MIPPVPLRIPAKLEVRLAQAAPSMREAESYAKVAGLMRSADHAEGLVSAVHMHREWLLDGRRVFRPTVADAGYLAGEDPAWPSVPATLVVLAPKPIAASVGGWRPRGSGAIWLGWYLRFGGELPSFGIPWDDIGLDSDDPIWIGDRGERDPKWSFLTILPVGIDEAGSPICADLAREILRPIYLSRHNDPRERRVGRFLLNAIAGVADGSISVRREYGRVQLPKRLRFTILQRDSYRCRYCGRGAPEVVLHVDHVTPVCAGGDNEPANLVTACDDCNLGKGGRPA